MAVLSIRSHHGDAKFKDGKVPRRLVNAIKNRVWTFEDSSLASSFNNYEWYYHSTGCCGQYRVSIVDEVVSFKVPTGSTTWIYFDSNSSAVEFWENNVGLPLIECSEYSPDRPFEKNETVVLLGTSKDWGVCDEIYFETDDRTFVVKRYFPTLDRVFLEAAGARPYIMFKNEKLGIKAFSLLTNKVMRLSSDSESL